MSPKKKRKTKLLVSLGVAAAVLAFAIVIPYYVKAQNRDGQNLTASETRTATVGTQDIRKVVSGSGQILSGDEETLTADQDKTVDEVLVTEGQAVEEGQALLSYTDGTELVSPCKGVAGTVNLTDSGSASKTADSAAANTISVQSTEKLVTQLSVDESDLQNLNVGQEAEITVNALPDAKHSGKVSAISETGTYSNGSSTFTVTLTLDETAEIKIGMSADVEIVVASVSDAVAVPIEAVSGSGDNAVVTVVKDGAASPVSVELGLANDAYVQITSGLSAGDIIQYTVQTGSAENSGRSGGFGGGMGGMQGGAMQGPGGNMPDQSPNGSSRQNAD
ncbi:biotin/lipoyl attachment domain-containing protein [Syntrophobotulus glycolicus DSM 8271]|uniref:Biotin/lipoyl attachment domain-containing protein n=1 Tax=Syntrophobotulus glycolicus (strain DSM 8271 / FlGlyR) TaxID=645991 RepID=F0T2K8_SYNGF|nr:HlyD family efflux transporter periplasmic adaptor subunit [Syntrophobotulus glycolicus]ADY55326.1 biotin/lipoyl attachment domain-containing protein [Syntrophobotulus glycolicus DSM 8271]